MKTFNLLPIAACILLFTARGTAAEHVFFHENVLGTSLELRVNSSTHVQAADAEGLVLAEIDRLNGIFSQYDSTSEFSRFLRLPAGQQMSVSPELLEVMHWSDTWNRVSGGVFNPAVELISREWQSAEQLGVEPTPGRLSELAARIRPAAWRLNADGFSATRTSDVPLSLDAIAKGAILDYVADYVTASLPEVSGLMINIGGDVVVAGDMHVNVSVANPQADAIGGSVIQTLPLYRSAVATSGSSERCYKIQGRRHSHLIDARTGQPVSHSLSATVVAENAATADAVATIVGVLPVAEGLAFVNQLRGVECLLVSASGLISTSAAWPADENSGEKAEASAKEETGHLMKIEFEISKPDNARRYRRPYVAVWVEDKDGFPVKTLSLFLMKNNPGPRWHRDLRRWYKDDQVRSLAEDVSLINTISKPTRNPGNYKVEWDGRDNAGKLIEAGEYTLLFEAAREHGTYQLIRHKFEFGGPGFKKQLKGNVEIGAASVSYESGK